MQYRVEEGQVLNIALMEAEPGSQVELGEVLLIGGDTPVVGTPMIAGAKVLANVVGDVKGDKIVVFKYKNKKRYRRRTGHRQQYTRIAISQIITQTATESSRDVEETPTLALPEEPVRRASEATAPASAAESRSSVGETSVPTPVVESPGSVGETPAPASSEDLATEEER
jgi:large subunit ribosomal protein L21